MRPLQTQVSQSLHFELYSTNRILRQTNREENSCAPPNPDASMPVGKRGTKPVSKYSTITGPPKMMDNPERSKQAKKGKGLGLVEEAGDGQQNATTIAEGPPFADAPLLALKIRRIQLGARQGQLQCVNGQLRFDLEAPGQSGEGLNETTRHHSQARQDIGELAVEYHTQNSAKYSSNDTALALPVYLSRKATGIL